MPNIYPAYFRLGLELVARRLQVNVTFVPRKSFAIVSMRAPSDVDLSACLMLVDRNIIGGHCSLFCEDESLQLLFCAQ